MTPAVATYLALQDAYEKALHRQATALELGALGRLCDAAWRELCAARRGATMIAFRLIDGRIERVAWDVPTVREPLPDPRDPRLLLDHKYSPRERRRMARAGTRGRRGARRVPTHGMPRYRSLTYRTWHGHLFAEPFGRRVLLYLPTGEVPGPEHGRLLDRALRERHHDTDVIAETPSKQGVPPSARETMTRMS